MRVQRSSKVQDYSLGIRAAVATAATLAFSLSAYGHVIIVPFLAGIAVIAAVDGTFGETIVAVRNYLIGCSVAMPVWYPGWVFRVKTACARQQGSAEACFWREWTLGFEAPAPSFSPGGVVALVAMMGLGAFGLCGVLPKFELSAKFPVVGMVACALTGAPPHLLWITLGPSLVFAIAAAAIPPDALAVGRVARERDLTARHVHQALRATARLFAAGSSGDVANRALATSALERAAEHLGRATRLEKACGVEQRVLGVGPVVVGDLAMAKTRLEVALQSIDWLVGRAEEVEEGGDETSAPKGTLWRLLAPRLDAAVRGLGAAAIEGRDVDAAIFAFDAAFAAVREEIVYGDRSDLVRRDHAELLRIYAFLFDFVSAATALVHIDEEHVMSQMSRSGRRRQQPEKDDDDDDDPPAKKKKKKKRELLNEGDDDVRDAWWHDPTRLGVAIAIGCALGLSPGKTGLNVWVPVTVAFVHQRRTASAFHAAKNRMEGTAAGAIFGLFVVGWATTLTNNHYGLLWRWIILLFLCPWIALTTAMRKDETFGYGALVAAFTPLVIVVQRERNHETSFVLRLKATLFGAALYLAVAGLIVPRRAQDLLVPKLARMLGALRDAFDDVVARTKPNGKSVSSCCSESLSDLRIMLAEATDLEKLSEAEPTFFGLYDDFDAKNYRALLDAFGEAVLWLDEAAHAIDLATRDPDLAALAADFRSLEYLRHHLNPRLADALENDARRRIEPRDDIIIRKGGGVPSPYALWRKAKKFSALNGVDTASLVQMGKKKKPQFSNAGALAYFAFVPAIENCATATATIVVCLDRILDEGPHRAVDEKLQQVEELDDDCCCP
ncbi:hypothetical protein CTAYLR_007656 [Chrysophaeum taylorii]|uniref:Integral membrane bound transporter domain-containing protein n=1 Tax=Chrysophaeum taylorii TaxID=2483200 RepID=A0AAD7U4Z2_9STRA|nr:hypothetical protein CTAYLR_007656 [Chrysophaeum taylorii]